MAEKFGLTLELAQGFHSFFGEHKEEYKNLLYKMNSLEVSFGFTGIWGEGVLLLL